jgi:hypothetical protein
MIKTSNKMMTVRSIGVLHVGDVDHHREFFEPDRNRRKKVRIPDTDSPPAVVNASAFTPTIGTRSSDTNLSAPLADE